jgi:hypothetical protein
MRQCAGLGWLSSPDRPPLHMTCCRQRLARPAAFVRVTPWMRSSRHITRIPVPSSAASSARWASSHRRSPRPTSRGRRGTLAKIRCEMALPSRAVVTLWADDGVRSQRTAVAAWRAATSRSRTWPNGSIARHTGARWLPTPVKRLLMAPPGALRVLWNPHGLPSGLPETSVATQTLPARSRRVRR